MTQRFLYDSGGSGAARERFQTMVTDLLSVRYPNANEVASPSGSDWGIDTYVGELDGAIIAWQSKFFPQWTGESQRGNVRASFNEIVAKARVKGFTIVAWTLYVPCILPPEEQRWFDGWKKRQERDYGIKCALVNGSLLRRHLMQPDAERVRAQYFPDAGTPPSPVEPVAVYDGSEDLSDTLFVMQLEEAGYRENDAAKGLFYAAEALVRDIASRGDAAAIAAINEVHLEVHHIWETQYNTRVPQADKLGRISGLVEQVMLEAAACADPPEVNLRPAHRRGMAHRLVEDQRAGWVVHWREIAAQHGSARERETEGALEHPLPGGQLR